MNLIYNIGIFLTSLVLKSIGLFNHKISLGVHGRAKTFKTLKQYIDSKDNVLWFHCASLGEYEQGLPVFQALRSEYANHKIVLSFFSPSGYEVKKQSPIADVVVYLPLDTKRNAKKFLDIVNPELIVFVKYDIWPNYLIEIKKRGIRAILISALFRKNQLYFKTYGKTLRKGLFAFKHIFTQNEASKNLLNSINYNHVTVSGDTRFDRVFNQLQQDNTLHYIETFKQDKLCVVAGSTWPKDEALLITFINSCKHDIKFIIAPHEINPDKIQSLKDAIKKPSILFSRVTEENSPNAAVFILDTIGVLTKVYSYADVAYVGGAMGNSGLHNTLEAAVFGIPIIIGPNYQKFPEALHMIEQGGMQSINNQLEFNSILNELVIDNKKRNALGAKNHEYIKKNRGAVIQIMRFIRT